MILDRREKPEDICAELARLAKAEPFASIFADTFAAWFDSKNVNGAVEGDEFMRWVRPLTQIPGLPAVVVSANRVKNANENNLVPYGSGAILNEVDRNLTLWRAHDTSGVSPRWQGKLRGLESIPPCPFTESLLGRSESLVRVRLPSIPAGPSLLLFWRECRVARQLQPNAQASTHAAGKGDLPAMLPYD